LYGMKGSRSAWGAFWSWRCGRWMLRLMQLRFWLLYLALLLGLILLLLLLPLLLLQLIRARKLRRPSLFSKGLAETLDASCYGCLGAR